MLIGINDRSEIKQINNISDVLLTVIEVDRETAFKGFSDFIILNYCYEIQSNGAVSVYPQRDVYDIFLEDKNNEILHLQGRVIELESEKIMYGEI